VIGADLPCCVVECCPELRARLLQSHLHLGGGHAEVVDGAPVEALRVLAERFVTARADGGDDLAHRVDDGGVDLVLRTREGRDEVAGEAAEVESRQQKESSYPSTP
jgi:anti-sigma factor RsiW